MILEKSSKIEYLFLILFLVAAFFVTTKFVKDKKYQNSLNDFVGKGDSMKPTILDGERIVADPSLESEVGDIIVFSCNKCKIKEDDSDILTKRVSKKKGDCLWVLGDNAERSYDSRDFGWLCPNEIDYHGVVIEYPDRN